jgi:hypothetical protein
MTTSVASKATWQKVSSHLLILWSVTVAGVTVYEWNSLPRPSGYFVEAVDPTTGKPHAYGKRALIRSDLEGEIARLRRVLEPPRTPTASERLFAKARDDSIENSLDESDRTQSQRWDEILNRLVPNTSIADSPERDRLLTEVSGIPLEHVSRNPEAAMRLARLLELKKTMSLSPILERQILDPEFDALSQPAVPRLRWVEFLAATITPMALFCVLAVLLPLMRRKVQLPARETNSEAFDAVQPVSAEAETSNRSPIKVSMSRPYRVFRMERNYWIYALGAVLFVLLMAQLGRYLGNEASQGTATPAQSGSPSTNAEVRVVVSSQDSEGVTQAQWDQKFLNNLESYTRERITQKAKELLAANGQPDATVNLESQAVYVESGNTKLAVIRIQGNDGSNQALIHGIVGNQLKRVGCVRNSTEQIPISYGPCGEKVKEVFGVSLSAR